MPWDNTQAFQTIFVDESDLERKLKDEYVKVHLAQSYFIELRNKRKVKSITLLDGLLKWKQYYLYVPKGKLCMKVMQEVQLCTMCL
jgi:hypothetical protein